MLGFIKRVLGFKKTRPQTFTIKDIRSWRPCYDPMKYLPVDWKGTVLDILDHKEIPFQDKLWVVCREELLSDKLLRLFAVYCARQVQHLMKDERSIKAIDVAERFTLGEATEEELEAASAAAGAAYDAAYRAAARAAACGAAYWAAGAARAAYGATSEAARGAYWAAYGAARAAAWDAAWDAAWAAEQDVQLAQQTKLREMIIEGIKIGDTK